MDRAEAGLFVTIVIIVGGIIISLLTAGGKYLILAGLVAQMLGFLTWVATDRVIPIKRKALEEMVNDEPKNYPNYFLGYRGDWDHIKGFVLILAGLIWQMVGLFSPEFGVIFDILNQS